MTFPEETEVVAKNVYDQIIKLRSTARDLMVANLKRFLRSEKSLQIALVLIADDPTQMRLVAHLPTMVFEDLRCAKLVAARMSDKLKDASKLHIPHIISREEFNELSIMVKEVPELIVQAKQAIILEMSTANELQNRHRAASADDSRAMTGLMMKMLSRIDSVEAIQHTIQETIKPIWSHLSRFIRYMTGFAEQAGYKDPEVAWEEGVRAALRGSVRR